MGKTYNSENTHILATHMAAGNNRRMLLLHICENGRHEYVIGSYFTEKRESAPDPRMARILDNEAKSFAPAMRGYGTRNLLEDLADEVRRSHPREIVRYSWDWGHYFQDPVAAFDYWKREVLWNEVELYEVSDGELDGCILQVTFNSAKWNAGLYEKDGKPMTYYIEGFSTKAELLEAFHAHRPSCALSYVGYMKR